MQSLRVLCVDDDALVLMSTIDMLEELGHRAVSASSGQAALSVLAEGTEPFDLLLTDQSMPGMSGLQLAVHARQLRPAMAVIVATGYSELSENSELRLPVLRKPFTQAELAHAIASATAGETIDAT